MPEPLKQHASTNAIGFRRHLRPDLLADLLERSCGRQLAMMQHATHDA